MGYIALKTQGAADLDVNNICIADLIKKNGFGFVRAKMIPVHFQNSQYERKKNNNICRLRTKVCCSVCSRLQAKYTYIP